MRKKLLYDPRPSLLTKQLLTNAFVDSILRLGIAAWPKLNKREALKADALHTRIRRDAAGFPPVPDHASHAAQLQVRAAHPALLPSHMHKCERLAYVARLLHHGPRMLMAMLDAEGSWWSQVNDDMSWMRQQLWLVAGLPDPHENPVPWEDIIAHANGTTWRKYIQQLRRVLAIRNRTEAYVELCTRRMKRMLGTEDSFAATPPAPHLDFACDICGAWFSSHAALATHRYGKHRIKASVRTLVSNVTCAACLKNFHTRHRIIAHLSKCHRCREHYYLRGTTPLSADEANALDDAEANHATKLRTQGQATGAQQLPVVQAAGPMHCIDDATDDMNILDYISCVQGSTTHQKQGTATANGTTSNRVDTPYYACTSTPQPPALTKARPPAADVGTQPGTTDHHQYAVPATDMARPLRFMVVWLSGRRRHGDIQHAIEACFDIDEFTIVVLSLDLVCHIDLSHIATVDKWLTRILDKQVIASPAIAPPCETWSYARQRVDQGPQAVRSADQPWGLPLASITEWKQISTGNLLMMVGLQARAAHSVANTPAALEHPADPITWVRDYTAAASAPSIWRTPQMTTLAALPNTTTRNISQGDYGAKSPKPTTFLTVNIPNDVWNHWSNALMLPIEQRRGPKYSSMGKDATGAWATAQLKEYPVRVCMLLAAAAIEAATGIRPKQRWSHDPSEWPWPDPPQWGTEHQHLAAAWNNDIGVMGPDYAGSSDKTKASKRVSLQLTDVDEGARETRPMQGTRTARSAHNAGRDDILQRVILTEVDAAARSVPATSTMRSRFRFGKRQAKASDVNAGHRHAATATDGSSQDDPWRGAGIDDGDVPPTPHAHAQPGAPADAPGGSLNTVRPRRGVTAKTTPRRQTACRPATGPKQGATTMPWMMPPWLHPLHLHLCSRPSTVTPPSCLSKAGKTSGTSSRASVAIAWTRQLGSSEKQ